MELFSVLSGKGPILFFPQSRPRNKVKNHSQRQYEILKLNQKTKNVATSLLERGGDWHKCVFSRAGRSDQ